MTEKDEIYSDDTGSSTFSDSTLEWSQLKTKSLHESSYRNCNFPNLVSIEIEDAEQFSFYNCTFPKLTYITINKGTRVFKKCEFSSNINIENALFDNCTFKEDSFSVSETESLSDSDSDADEEPYKSSITEPEPEPKPEPEPPKDNVKKSKMVLEEETKKETRSIKKTTLITMALLGGVTFFAAIGLRKRKNK